MAVSLKTSSVSVSWNCSPKLRCSSARQEGREGPSGHRSAATTQLVILVCSGKLLRSSVCEEMKEERSQAQEVSGKPRRQITQLSAQIPTPAAQISHSFFSVVYPMYSPQPTVLKDNVQYTIYKLVQQNKIEYHLSSSWFNLFLYQ